MKKIFSYILITVLTIILAKDFLLVEKFPSTHDGENLHRRIWRLNPGAVPDRNSISFEEVQKFAVDLVLGGSEYPVETVHPNYLCPTLLNITDKVCDSFVFAPLHCLVRRDATA